MSFFQYSESQKGPESPRSIFIGSLFQHWDKSWGLRGDPYLWDELRQLLLKEPLPASLTQLVALIEKSFEQLVGAPLSAPVDSIYVDRYNQGGISGGHVCLPFWRNEAIPEIQRKYLSIYKPATPLSSGRTFLSKGPRFIDKPCRYEYYPEGCRFGETCRFRHSHPPRQELSNPPPSTSRPHYIDNLHPLHQSLSQGGYPLDEPLKPSVSLDLSPYQADQSLMYRTPHSPMSVSAMSSIPPHSIPCPHYVRGKCVYGDQCRYKHI